MTDYYEIIAKRGNERERKIIGTDADISRFEKSGYKVTSEPTLEKPKTAAGSVVIKINTEAADIIADRIIEKMRAGGFVVEHTEEQSEEQNKEQTETEKPKTAKK